METCPANTLFPAKGCPAYRSSPVLEMALLEYCVPCQTVITLLGLLTPSGRGGGGGGLIQLTRYVQIK
jgi:hypothetical protein